MEVIEIDAKEFPKRKLPCEFGIMNESYMQIYKFFKKFPQNAVYSINSTLSIEAILNSSDQALFNSCGIYVNANTVNGEKKVYALYVPFDVLDSDTTFAEFVENEKRRIGCTNFSLVFLECDVADSDKDDVISVISAVLPNVNIANKGFTKKAEVVQTKLMLDPKNYTDLAPIVSKYQLRTNSMTINLRNAYSMLEEIEQTATGKTFYHFNPIGDVGKFNFEYSEFLIGLITYLTAAKGLMFELSDSMTDNVLREAEKLVSQKYNYAHEYFKFVQNPLDAGFVKNGNGVFLFIKNKEWMASKHSKYTKVVYGPTLDFDLTSRMFDATGEVNTSYVNLDEVEILNLPELFEITGTDWGRACKGSRNLNALFNAVEVFFKRNNIALKEPMTVSNTYLFRDKSGKVKLGYVTRVEGLTRYLVKPLVNNLDAFTQDISVEMLPKIIDFNFTQDCAHWERLIKKIDPSVTHLHYDLPDTARGILANHLSGHKDGAQASLATHMTVEQLGLWLLLVHRLKGESGAAIVNDISSTTCREASFLTAFGGPCAFLTTEIIINS